MRMKNDKNKISQFSAPPSSQHETNIKLNKIQLHITELYGPKQNSQCLTQCARQILILKSFHYKN